MPIGVVAIALITLGNLRGLRESGNIFAVPTYLFVGSALLMIAMASTGSWSRRGHAAAEPVARRPDRLEPLTILLLLRPSPAARSR